MNYQAIYQECIDLRFNNLTAKVAQVKKWVNQAEIAVWNSADWEFKRIPAATVAVTAGAVTEPSDFGKVHRLWNANGDELLYVPPDEFESTYSVGPQAGGIGEAYTVINRAVQVGPAETSLGYKMSYRCRYTHLASGGGRANGVMSADTDTPLWDSEFHYLLVPWAIMLGQKLEYDPTAEYLRVQRDEMLAAMKDELVLGQEEPQAAWGDSLREWL